MCFLAMGANGRVALGSGADIAIADTGCYGDRVSVSEFGLRSPAVYDDIGDNTSENENRESSTCDPDNNKTLATNEMLEKLQAD